MSEHKRNKDADTRYRKQQLDFPPTVNIKQSVLETRRIYSNLTDSEFIAFYHSRYRVTRTEIARVLDRAKVSNE